MTAMMQCSTEVDFAKALNDDFHLTAPGQPASISEALLTIPSAHLDHGTRWLRRAKNRRQLWQWFQEKGVMTQKTAEAMTEYFVCFNTWQGSPYVFGQQLAAVLGLDAGDPSWTDGEAGPLWVWSFSHDGDVVADVFLSTRGVVVVQGVSSASRVLHGACKSVLHGDFDRTPSVSDQTSESGE
eukprot:CAMPEP_0204253832 /NCGR_PEP_ID=MMETSP0468-20130131/2130_1 /ASSEMBLY_ACC=CAM_ASM_000383 /TAXON_ID=2969 /ORGANISM="Oxyrrhis marina" /LENGTH=182 /DNA_ID=CAMNT_0051227469 /DNA_START=44 /DNA_END=592 /DNA_ORIENTATION=+